VATQTDAPAVCFQGSTAGADGVATCRTDSALQPTDDTNVPSVVGLCALQRFSNPIAKAGCRTPRGPLDLREVPHLTWAFTDGANAGFNIESRERRS
jgi:hypothetical protein